MTLKNSFMHLFLLGWTIALHYCYNALKGTVLELKKSITPIEYFGRRHCWPTCGSFSFQTPAPFPTHVICLASTDFHTSFFKNTSTCSLFYIDYTVVLEHHSPQRLLPDLICQPDHHHSKQEGGQSRSLIQSHLEAVSHSDCTPHTCCLYTCLAPC